MSSLDEYPKAVINSFRDRFKKEFDSKEQSYIKNNLRERTFLAPCQIEIIDSKNPLQQGWIVTFDRDRPDMEFIFHENIEDLKSFIENKRKDPNWLKQFPEDRKEYFIKDLLRAKSKHLVSSWMHQARGVFIIFNYDVRKKSPEGFARDSYLIWHLRTLLKDLERKKIKEETKALRKGVGKVTKKGLRSALLSKISGIETRLKRLDEHDSELAEMKEEIGGVRKLIGVSEEFQEWKALASSVEDLKSEQVSKEVFISEIKRLDQRIGDLKTIKLLSIRTIIEILLAIAAILATLVAAGVIRF